MNILTKICVVILLVTSLIVCVVCVNLATNVPNYRYFYEQKQLELKQKEAKIRTQMAGNTEDRRALDAKKKESSDKLHAAKIENDNLRLRLREAKQENVELKRKLTGEQASLAGLTRSHEAHVKMNSELHRNLTTAREDAQKKHAAAINAETLLKKSQAKVEFLEGEMSVRNERAKRLKADYIAVSEKLAVLERRYGVTDAATPTDPLLPAERVTGTITAIRDNLASINIGSSSGLEKGMKLIIYRGADFVGKLKLENVDVNEAAGILMDGNPLAPLKGDKVTTKLD